MFLQRMALVVVLPLKAASGLHCAHGGGNYRTPDGRIELLSSYVCIHVDSVAKWNLHLLTQERPSPTPSFGPRRRSCRSNQQQSIIQHQFRPLPHTRACRTTRHPSPYAHQPNTKAKLTARGGGNCCTCFDE